MSSKIKVAMITNNMLITGIGTVIMNYSKNLDKHIFEVNIISGTPIAENYKEECEKHNIRLEEITSKKKNPLIYYYSIMKLLNNNKYDIVHVHGNSSLMAVELLICKFNGVKNRIAHCHNSSAKSIFVHKLLLPLFRKTYTIGIACSNAAGKWVFGNKDFMVLPNGFETDLFKYNYEKRDLIRNELGIQHKFVIGHVGRFNFQKNHDYIMDMFERLIKNNNDIVLLLVGTGGDFERIKTRVNELNYNNNVIFYGETLETNVLYSVMDLFVFPSRYEGFGIVLLEAQAAGLPCIASTAVPQSTKVTQNVMYIDIEKDDLEEWCNIVLQYKNTNFDRDKVYEENKNDIEKYDIKRNTKILEKLYCNIIKNGEV